MMIMRTLILVGVTAGLAATARAQTCAPTSTHVYNFSGGVVGSKRDAVVAFRDQSNPPVYYGTGTLIAPNLVLTVAHIELETGMHAVFFDEMLDPYTPRTAQPRDIQAIVERGDNINAMYDYRIVQIATPPAGVVPTTVRTHIPQPGWFAAFISHPKPWEHAAQNERYFKKAGTGYVNLIEGLFQYNLNPQLGGVTYNLIRFGVKDYAGSSGGGLLDYAGTLVGLQKCGLGACTVSSLPVCDYGNGTMAIADMVHVSPKLREILPTTTVTLRAWPSRTSHAQISVSCGSDYAMNCSMSNNTTAGFAQLQDKGCAIDCPKGSTVTVRCQVLSGAYWARVLRDVGVYRTAVNQPGQSWRIDSQSFGGCAYNTRDCTTSFVADKPIYAYCDFDEI